MIVDQTGSVERIVTREAFTKVGEAHGKIPRVITRAWNDTRSTAELYAGLAFVKDAVWVCQQVHTDPNLLDFEDAMKGIRFMESGSARFLSIGETAWNIVANINNEGLQPNNPDYLLEWVDAIHPGFRGGVASRERTAQQIADVYAHLGSLTVAQVNAQRN